MTEKYKNQIVIKEFGLIFYNKINDINTKILVIGLGGIGCAVLNHLCCTGFINLGILDYDIITNSNLHRQYLYTEEDVNKYKTEIAKNYCLKRNSKININEYNIKITNKNALDIIKKYDYILDCTDNQNTRFIINDACVLLNKFYIFGSSIQTSGQISIFNYKNNCCYRCINCYTDNIEKCNSCSIQGVLGPIPNLIGNMMVIELIKIINEKLKMDKSNNDDNDDNDFNKIIIYDYIHGFNYIKMPAKNKNCLVCSNHNIINADNFNNLDIYNNNNTNNNKYSYNEEISISSTLSQIKSVEHIFINDYDDINIKYEELLKLTNNDNISYIINCNNGIKSSILVEKLRNNNCNNFWNI